MPKKYVQPCVCFFCRKKDSKKCLEKKEREKEREREREKEKESPKEKCGLPGNG